MNIALKVNADSVLISLGQQRNSNRVEPMTPNMQAMHDRLMAANRLAGGDHNESSRVWLKHYIPHLRYIDVILSLI